MKPVLFALASAVFAASLVGCGNTQGLMAPQTRTMAIKAASVPAGYYDQAEGQRGQGLVQALADIVTKHKDLGYARARDVMFGDADDPTNSNTVECDYTGRKMNNVSDRNSAYKGGAGFNAEHTWPQSKGAEGVAKSDLHHLFPTDCNANSKRSSFPFGEVKSVTWSEGGSKLGRDAAGRIVFEPRDEQKGNTARAILYFYTVYGRRASLENFKVEEKVMLQWHEQDPPDAIDRQRNDVVYAAQGNRNPFVDHPEFVKLVGSFSGRLAMPAFALN